MPTRDLSLREAQIIDAWQLADQRKRELDIATGRVQAAEDLRQRAQVACDAAQDALRRLIGS